MTAASTTVPPARDPHARHPRCRHPRCRRGTVLIVTMWIVLVLAGLVLVMTHSMRVEAVASANRRAALQAEAVARGAMAFVISLVESGEVDADESLFEEREVGDGLFWILRPDLEDDAQCSFGLTDEAGRINLNAASADSLLKLPGMTTELADAILDWRGGRSEDADGSTGSQYYLLLDEPYFSKNGPLETVEEVLLVRDATAEVLYGEDRNRNGVLDPNEDDAEESDPSDDRNGVLDRGFLPYVTVYTREPNLSADGQERVNVNNVDTQALNTLLREVITDDRIFTILDTVRRGRPYENIFDFYHRSGLRMEEFAPIADRLTTVDEEEVAGLVNVNTAPREVLLCLPELDEADVDALLTRRADSATDLTSVAWVADTIPQERATAIGSYVTNRSYQFSADIVAVSGDGRAFRRYRIVVDAQEGPAKIIRCQDLTHLGWPLDPEILTSLRRPQ